MSREKLVDPECFSLAEHFISDDDGLRGAPDADIDAAIKSLSEDIQEAVEDWFSLRYLGKIKPGTEAAT